jgi:flagellar basal body-associated protein FliL
MTEETYEMVDAPEKKGSRTLWIILAIVAVILIACCCVVILSAVILGIMSYATADPYFLLTPLISLL